MIDLLSFSIFKNPFIQHAIAAYRNRAFLHKGEAPQAGVGGFFTCIEAEPSEGYYCAPDEASKVTLFAVHPPMGIGTFAKEGKGIKHKIPLLI